MNKIFATKDGNGQIQTFNDHLKSSSSSSSSKRLKFQQEEYIVKERHDSTN